MFTSVLFKDLFEVFEAYELAMILPIKTYILPLYFSCWFGHAKQIGNLLTPPYFSKLARAHLARALSIPNLENRVTAVKPCGLLGHATKITHEQTMAVAI